MKIVMKNSWDVGMNDTLSEHIFHSRYKTLLDRNVHLIIAEVCLY